MAGMAAAFELRAKADVHIKAKPVSIPLTSQTLCMPICLQTLLFVRDVTWQGAENM